MNDIQQIHPRDGGSAYGRPPQHPDALLTGVGPGTPCGEYLRRYWQPVGESAALTSDRPQETRILGEDLVLFRDKAGNPGLLYPRCMHRGTSLYYGKVEERGLRCCYHGWLFDVKGNCLEQPCEPEGGLHREAARQPWYPVTERYGLVFAYMGPPDRQPVLPHYDILEDLEADEELHVRSDGYFAYAAPFADPNAPYHWLQNWENLMDPYHVFVLHSTFSNVQFHESLKVRPKVDFEMVPGGVVYHAYRDLEDGRHMDRVNTALLPNISAIPPTSGVAGRAPKIGWHLAVDDMHFRTFFATRAKKGTQSYEGIKVVNGKLWTESTPEERRDYPSDFEAQAGQGAISLHSEEHLATSDRGIVMLRRKMRQAIDAVAQGGDPEGVTFDPTQAVVRIKSGNFYTVPAK